MPRKMNKIIIFFFILMSSSFTGLKAVNLAEADSAYYNHNYEKAAAIYSETIEEEGISAGLLYNLGNCYYRLGRDGEAILSYERAKKLDPGNKMIIQNLDFLTSRVIDFNKGSLQGKAGNVEPDQETFIQSIYRKVAVDTKSNNWAILAVMAFILFMGSMGLYVFTPNVLARKTGFFSGLTFIGFTLIFLVFAYIGAHQYQKQEDIILMDFTTQLLQEADENSQPSTSPLHKGTKLKILESKKGQDGTVWLKVKLNSENIGWIKKEGIEII